MSSSLLSNDKLTSNSKTLTANGLNVISKSTTITDSVVLGNNSNTNLLTGTKNIIIGNGTLLNTTNISNALIIGNSSQKNNSSGINNFTIGPNTLYNNVSGSFNTAIGASTLLSVVNTGSNIAIGYKIGEYSTQLFTNNILVGTLVCRNNTLLCKNNIAISAYSISNTVYEYKNNTTLGVNIFYNVNVPSSDNVMIGDEITTSIAGFTINVNKNVIVGSNIFTISGFYPSYSVLIGNNILFQTSDPADLYASNNVLIGTKLFNDATNALGYIQDTIAIGHSIVTRGPRTGIQSVLIGANAQNDTASVCIGHNTGLSVGPYSSLQPFVPRTRNVGIGALTLSVDQNYNGSGGTYRFGTVASNVAIGYGAISTSYTSAYSQGIATSVKIGSLSGRYTYATNGYYQFSNITLGYNSGNIVRSAGCITIGGLANLKSVPSPGFYNGSIIMGFQAKGDAALPPQFDYSDHLSIYLANAPKFSTRFENYPPGYTGGLGPDIWWGVNMNAISYSIPVFI